MSGVFAGVGINGGDVAKSGDKGGREGLPPHNATSPQSSLRFPKSLGDAAFTGLAGKIVRAIEPHTEADAAAVLASTLTMFGNAIGRRPYFLAGDAEHATNLYTCVIGETSSGRKGTSAEGARRLIVAADPDWRRCIASGLVSGEGVIHHVRDERSIRRKPKKGETVGSDGLVEELVDAGVQDKRLMAFVPEFAQVLGVIARKDNTLSAVLRDLWDRGDAQTVAKNSPEKVTGALVSVLAHITPHELRARLDSTEVANGFANRFLFVASQRSKLLPRGGSIPSGVLNALVPDIVSALEHSGKLLGEVGMTPGAWRLWDDLYGSLTTRPPGLVGAITGRAAPMVRRLALIYALLDERTVVDESHLLAAVEMWRYVEESVRWVFGDRLGQKIADRCLALLREEPNGLTRSELRDELGHRTPSEQTTDALQLLHDAKLARWVSEPTAGRPVERWFATEGDER